MYLGYTIRGGPYKVATCLVVQEIYAYNGAQNYTRRLSVPDRTRDFIGIDEWVVGLQVVFATEAALHAGATL